MPTGARRPAPHVAGALQRLLGAAAEDTRGVAPSPLYVHALRLVTPWPPATAARTVDATVALLGTEGAAAERLALAEALASLSAERLALMVVALMPLRTDPRCRWPVRAGGTALAAYACELQLWPLPASRWAAAVTLMLATLDHPPTAAQLGQGLAAIAAMDDGRLAEALRRVP